MDNLTCKIWNVNPIAVHSRTKLVQTEVLWAKGGWFNQLKVNQFWGSNVHHTWWCMFSLIWLWWSVYNTYIYEIMLCLQILNIYFPNKDIFKKKTKFHSIFLLALVWERKWSYLQGLCLYYSFSEKKFPVLKDFFTELCHCLAFLYFW